MSEGDVKGIFSLKKGSTLAIMFKKSYFFDKICFS